MYKRSLSIAVAAAAALVAAGSAGNPVHPITALVWLAIGMTGIAMAVDPVRAGQAG